MKSRLMLLCLCMMVLLSMPAAAADQITVTVNGEKINFDQQPIIENDRTVIPLRAISEAFEPKTSLQASQRRKL